GHPENRVVVALGSPAHPPSILPEGGSRPTRRPNAGLLGIRRGVGLRWTPRRSPDMLIVYAVTIFLSATLLFLVHPMFAPMLLPLLGGARAVWNTAMVFYQAALLAGYGYAHATAAWLGPRRQLAVHAAVLLAPLLVLPIGVPPGWTPPSQGNPIPWLLGVLTVA